MCVANPPEAAITITVYASTATSCDSSQVPDVRIPTYEGCNEDFPLILDLTCVALRLLGCHGGSGGCGGRGDGGGGGSNGGSSGGGGGGDSRGGCSGGGRAGADDVKRPQRCRSYVCGEGGAGRLVSHGVGVSIRVGD
jgi:hypothetical protein